VTDGAESGVEMAAAGEGARADRRRLFAVDFAFDGDGVLAGLFEQDTVALEPDGRGDG
jgi:hypothetical protein